MTNNEVGIGGEIVGWLCLSMILIGIPWWVIWNYDLNPMSDEITVYPQKYKCKDNDKHKCKWVNQSSTTFKVNKDSQTVIFWSSDNPGLLQEAEDCIVVNKKHWNCGKYYKIGFNDEGDYIYEDTNVYRYVSKTRWWISK